MNVFIRDQPVDPGLVIRVGGGGEAAPANALAGLGHHVLGRYFVGGFHFHHIFVRGGFHQEIRIVLLASLPEQTQLIQRRLDPADNLRVFLQNDGEQTFRIAVETVLCSIPS